MDDLTRSTMIAQIGNWRNEIHQKKLSLSRRILAEIQTTNKEIDTLERLIRENEEALKAGEKPRYRRLGAAC